MSSSYYLVLLVLYSSIWASIAAFFVPLKCFCDAASSKLAWIVSKVENVVLGEDEAISTRVINMQLNFYFWLHTRDTY